MSATSPLTRPSRTSRTSSASSAPSGSPSPSVTVSPRASDSSTLSRSRTRPRPSRRSTSRPSPAGRSASRTPALVFLPRSGTLSASLAVRTLRRRASSSVESPTSPRRSSASSSRLSLRTSSPLGLRGTARRARAAGSRSSSFRTLLRPRLSRRPSRALLSRTERSQGSTTARRRPRMSEGPSGLLTLAAMTTKRFNRSVVFLPPLDFRAHCSSELCLARPVR